jgi:phosphatidate cytidylyltransferase
VLLQRVIVAAIGLPLLGLLIWAPEPVFAGVVEAILAVAAFEIMRSVAPRAPLSLALSAAAATALFVALVRVEPDLPLWGFLLVTVFALAALLWRRTRMADHLGGWWLAAVLYTGVLGAHIVLIRPLDDGQRWLILLLAATFATDTAAYAVGRLLGRHRLWPAVSPNKTWEGFAGGLIGGAVAAVAALFLLDLADAIATEALVAVAIVLPLAAVAGDLLESAIKRRMGVKDMSGLLPGHGGFADRVDSVLVAATCLYWIVRWQT